MWIQFVSRLRDPGGRRSQPTESPSFAKSQVLQKVRDQYLDKDMKRGRCKLSVEHLGSSFFFFFFFHVNFQAKTGPRLVWPNLVTSSYEQCS